MKKFLHLYYDSQCNKNRYLLRLERISTKNIKEKSIFGDLLQYIQYIKLTNDYLK